MPTAAYKVDGKRVPGVTTILGKFKDPGALMHWAWQEGIEGRNFRDTSGAAASAGTIAHDMIEHKLLGDAYTPPEDTDPEVLERAERGFAAYLTWEQQSSLRVIDTEMQLTSAKHLFGGCPDAVGYVGDGGLAVIDWKTSNAVYGDYFMQLCAYKLLWEENYPDQPITGGIHLCRFSKDYADFEHRHFASGFEDGERAFLMMRELYDIVARINKRVR